MWLRLQLPVEMPAEYDVLLTASRTSPSDPDNGLVLIVPKDGHQGVVGRFHIAHGWGIDRVDGKGLRANGTFVADKHDFAAATSRVVIKVRHGGVTLTCNDELIVDWRGRGEQLSHSVDFVIPNKRALGIAWHAGFNNSSARGHSRWRRLDAAVQRT